MLYFGILDILTRFGVHRRVECEYKKLKKGVKIITAFEVKEIQKNNTFVIGNY